MAKNECPLCGGPLELKAPARGYGFKWLVCTKKGDDPNCKGRVHAGYQKKEAGTPAKTTSGNVPVRSVPASQPQPAGKRGLLERFLEHPIL